MGGGRSLGDLAFWPDTGEVVSRGNPTALMGDRRARLGEFVVVAVMVVVTSMLDRAGVIGSGDATSRATGSGLVHWGCGCEEEEAEVVKECSGGMGEDDDDEGGSDDEDAN